MKQLLRVRSAWTAGRRCTPTHFRRGLLTQGYAKGPSEPPLLEETVGQNFARIVSQYGDRPAVISRPQGRYTYQELDQQSNILGHGLQSVGVKKGDRVCVQLGNNLEFAAITYALFKLGAILVPLNPSFNTTQLTAALNHLSATHLVISSETNLPFRPPRSNVPLLESILPDLTSASWQSEAIPSLTKVILVDNSAGRIDVSKWKAMTPWAAVSQDTNTSAPNPDSELSNKDIVNIQFTSGTTSTPKAACLSHRSILNNGAQIGSRMLLTEKDVVVCPPPLFHCFGCILGYMATATHGSAIVFPAEAFDPLATLKSIQEEKGTALYGVPTMFLAQLELINNGTVPYQGFEHLRTGIAAGTNVPAELMRRLHKVLNLTELTICYGMTETSPVSFMTFTDDPMEKRINTVGRLMPHVEAKIVDPANRDKVMGVDERGELVVSGYLVMKEYWEDPKKTAEAMTKDSDGKIWMHTGDEASMDADGYVAITGRIKDLIIRGGENIHPLEIENCLLAHDGIKDVSVVGLPDEKYGEVVAAFVIRRHEEGVDDAPIEKEEVRNWVRERLSHHLVPKYVYFIHDYPKTPSGKIQKYRLREMGMQMLRGSVGDPEV